MVHPEGWPPQQPGRRGLLLSDGHLGGRLMGLCAAGAGLLPLKGLCWGGRPSPGSQDPAGL